jgi:hypothetical protein
MQMHDRLLLLRSTELGVYPVQLAFYKSALSKTRQENKTYTDDRGHYLTNGATFSPTLSLPALPIK